MMKTSMTKAKSLFAVLSVALLLAAGDAKASFNYSVAVSPSSQNFGAGSNYTLAPAFTAGSPSPMLTGNQTINLVQTTQTSTTAFPATDTTSIPITVTTTINNLNGGGSGTITLSGTINVTRSDSLGANSNFVMTSILPSSLTLDGFTYSLSAPTYTAPTIAGGAGAGGGISITVTETAIPGVPEPASLVMMGTSVLALGGLTVLRRLRQG